MKHRFLTFALAMLLSIQITGAVTETTNTVVGSTAAVAIPDNGSTTSTIVVSGAGTYLFDVNVQTFLTHTFAADLDVTITSPAGTVVKLTTDNGAGNDDVFNGTIWDDDANPAGALPYTTNNGLVTDHAYVNATPVATLVPEGSLGAFIGEDPNGTWTMTITDDLAGDTGSLTNWSLNLTTITAAPQIADTTFNSTGAVAVPTGPAVVTSTIVVSGMGSSLLDVNLQTFLTHTFSADLDISITSPAGTVVTLTTDNGAGNDNTFNGTIWDDNGTETVTDHTYVNLTTAASLIPEEAFAAFVDEDPNGTWTLTISDDLTGDGGSLDSWSLDLTTYNQKSVSIGDLAATDEGSSGTTNFDFTVTRVGSTSGDVSMTYTVSGAAVDAADFGGTMPTGTVTITDGNATATLSIPVNGDTGVETDEAFSVELSAPDNGYDVSGVPATSTINNDDSATLSIAKISDGAEANTPSAGMFQVTQSATSHTDTTVSYTVTGTATPAADFTALSGSVTIPAGQTTADIDVTVLNDGNTLEPTESVTVTLDAITESDSNITLGTTLDATLDITDDDTATVIVTKINDGSETPSDLFPLPSGPVFFAPPPSNVLFRFNQSAAATVDTVMTYTLGGTATSGDDYTAPSGTVTIPAGQTFAYISVYVTDDTIVEETETVSLTISAITSGDADITLGATRTDSATITDNDSATVTLAKINDGAEPGTSALFRVTQSTPSSTNTTVTFTLGGTTTPAADYALFSGSVTIPAGQSTADISVAPTNDTVVESTETISVTLNGFSAGDTEITLGATVLASADLTDDDSATVSIAKVNDGIEAVSPTDALFRVTQTAAASVDSVITYTVGGTATPGTDFTPPSGSVTIAAGQTTAEIIVSVLNDSTSEPTETVTITLTGFTARDPQVTRVAPLTASARITTAAVNKAPTVVPPGLPDRNMVVGDANTIELLGNFIDTNSDILTYSLASNSNPAIASAIVSGTKLRLGALANGTTQIKVRASDGMGGFVTDSFTVKVSTPAVKAIQVTTGRIKVNPNTGLFDVKVKVKNTTSQRLNGFRLFVDYEKYTANHPTLRLFNASSPRSSKRVYIDYRRPVAVDDTVILTLSYYVRGRTFPKNFKPIYRVKGFLPPAKLASPHADPDSCFTSLETTTLPNGDVRVEFPAVNGLCYRVSYSSDETHWVQSPTPVQAHSSTLYWIDRNPSAGTRRSYQIQKITAP